MEFSLRLYAINLTCLATLLSSDMEVAKAGRCNLHSDDLAGEATCSLSILIYSLSISLKSV